MRYLNKTAEKNRGSIGEQASPHSKRIDSGKKVSKMSSQELLKGQAHVGQYLPTGALPAATEKKGAKHLYMSLNKEKAPKSNSHRDKSVSSDNHYMKHALTGGKVREKNSAAMHKKGKAGRDYEIVFDHMNEDSMPENPSYDMEEQPTVVLVEEMHPHEVLA